MTRQPWPALLGLAVWLAATSAAQAQVRPYIGFVYPAGGQQGTTVQVRLGGQGLDEVNAVLITGKGVHAKVFENHRRLNFQELQLLREQLQDLRAAVPGRKAATTKDEKKKDEDKPDASLPPAERDRLALISKIEKRMAEFVPAPASAALASVVLVDVTFDADAPPTPREIRLVTRRGVSNPLVFQVGQFPEVARKPMLSATIQTLGKEEQALRKRPADEVEQRVTLPCTVNGQIASGEVNRYRFEARKGQKLVLTTAARQLVPYIADAVPGWFQPVLTLGDARGKELAYNDDYRFKPDPVILFEVPRDGEYTFAITDALYRGREDFVYRVTIGELPFVTSLFPLGARVGKVPPLDMKGWNLEGALLEPPPSDAGPGTYSLVAAKDGLVSNRLPFALDTLPEIREKEPNNDAKSAQPVNLPVIANGRIDRPGDIDVYRFQGKAGARVVAEIIARRLDSPLDSVLRLTGPDGALLAFNDDREDPGSGLNTHHADSYLTLELPADGVYAVSVSDAARSGGPAHGYRLRISPPRPDFELRLVPSSVTLRSKAAMSLGVFAIRRDGFAGPIKLALKDPPEGFVAQPITLAATQETTRLNIRTTLAATSEPVTLQVEGTAQIQGRAVLHACVPAEDRMQAFLWRHMVPAEELRALVFDPTVEPPPRRPTRVKLPQPQP